MRAANVHELATMISTALFAVGCSSSSSPLPVPGATATARPVATASGMAPPPADAPPANAACPDARPCIEDCAPTPKQIAAGHAHTCALSTTGDVFCWGDGARGQLGDPSLEPRLRPTKIATRAQGVAAGDGFTCLIEGGAVRCLGALRNRWLGPDRKDLEQICKREGGAACQGAAARSKLEQTPGMKEAIDALWKEQNAREEAERTVPRAITPPLTGAVSIVANGIDVCTLDAAGKATCFIYAPADSTTASIYRAENLAKPHRIDGVTDLVEVAAGPVQSCGRTRGGVVACWTRFGVAQQVATMKGAKSIAVTRDEACVVTENGDVSCFATRGAPSPAKRPGLSKVVELRAGSGSMCARTASGTVTCWGSATGAQAVDAAPSRTIDGAGNATAITVGDAHACAITSDGVRCWGDTTRGALGDGAMPEVLAPVDVTLDAAVVDVSANQSTTCAVLAGGRVRCWGYGYTPAGTITGEGPASALIDGITGAERVFVGENQACAIAGGGTVSCWPHDGAEVPAERVAGIDDAISVAPGVAVSCAATRKGETRCWWQGNDASVLPGVRDMVEVAQGASDWSCGRTRSGTMSCWSMTSDDMPGDAWQKPKTFAFPGATNLTSIATSAFVACGARKDGALVCAGGTKPKKASPRPEFTDVAQIAIANATTLGALLCARTRAGGVRCSGSNEHGELGIGTFAPALLGTVAGPSDLQGVTDVAVGARHVCALRPAGKVACWGSDAFGQVSGVARGHRTCARPVARF